MSETPADTTPLRSERDRVHQVSERDLPLVCPLPSMNQWNAHPRVYLELDGDGRAMCPYCGTVYQFNAAD